MFAAGNNSKEALVALMDAGGQQALSLQDNRGNNVLKYALEACEVKTLLEVRWALLLAEPLPSIHCSVLWRCSLFRGNWWKDNPQRCSPLW